MGPPSVILGDIFQERGFKQGAHPEGILQGLDSVDALLPFWNILGN